MPINLVAVQGLYSVQAMVIICTVCKLW